jgi:CelD/BcsL family acetyltransferase involved in cellulose biosynthesis
VRQDSIDHDLPASQSDAPTSAPRAQAAQPRSQSKPANPTRYVARLVRLGRRAANARFEHAWHRLEAVAALPTQGHAFAQAVTHTMLAGQLVSVLLVRRPGGLAALMPLVRKPGWLERWRMVGAREVYEPGDVLSQSPQAARALAVGLARLRRPVALDRVPAQSGLIPDLRRAMRGRGWLRVRPATGCPTIALGPDWHTPEARFNAGRRSDFRRAMRRAEALGAVSFEVIAPDAAQFDALFDEAVAIEHASWKAEAGTALACEPEKQALFRSYFRAACAQGQFRAAFMRIDGQAVAMQLAVEQAGRFWLFKIGYDEAYGKCSPGTLLMLHTLGYAARRDLLAYELLGNVEPWIAALWTEDSHECLSVRTYPFGLRGALALGTDCWVWGRERLRAQVAATLARKPADK